MAKISLGREKRNSIYILYEQPGSGGMRRDIAQDKLDELLALQKEWEEAQRYLGKVYWKTDDS